MACYSFRRRYDNHLSWLLLWHLLSTAITMIKCTCIIIVSVDCIVTVATEEFAKHAHHNIRKVEKCVIGKKVPFGCRGFYIFSIGQRAHTELQKQTHVTKKKKLGWLEAVLGGEENYDGITAVKPLYQKRGDQTSMSQTRASSSSSSP